MRWGGCVVDTNYDAPGDEGRAWLSFYEMHRHGTTHNHEYRYIEDANAHGRGVSCIRTTRSYVLI